MRASAENLLDPRFVGRAVKLRVMGIDEILEGIVDEVSRYEIGLRIRDRPVIVFRHSVLFFEVSEVDFHGYSSEELEDTVLTSDFIGGDIEVTLINGERLEGRLLRISKYEIGIRSGGRSLIIPKSTISVITLLK